MSQPAPRFDPPGEAGGEKLQAVNNEGFQEPFFDPDLPVEEIDLSSIKTKRKGLEHEPPDGKKVLHFLTVTASGDIDDERFEELFAHAAGDVLVGVKDGETMDVEDPASLMELYDFLEDKNPRTVRLLERIRDEGLYSPDHTAAITRLTLRFEGYRHATEMPE